MAECNYDEVTHSVYPPENSDPMYHWDAHFPERLSRLHLSLELSSPVFRKNNNRRAKERCSGRFKTQPITFDEIAEVDDEDTSGVAAAVTSSSVVAKETKVASFRSQIPGFSRSVDGLVASRFIHAKSGNSTGSDKENTPCDPERRVDESEPLVPVPVFPFDGPGDAVRHRRKRSGRRLRYRNSVPEEVNEAERMEESTEVE